VHLQNAFDIKKGFLEDIQQIEFVKQGKVITNLDDIFVFPNLTKDKDAFTREIIEQDYFLEDLNKSVVIKGREFSGKTALLRWLFLRLRNKYAPILLDGNTIFKTLNFEDHIKKEFDKELTGDFDAWINKDNKVAIIDNYHHQISSNILKYLDENFVMIIIGMDDEEYLVYFKDDPAFTEFSNISLGQFTLSQQEELISNWVQLGSSDKTPIVDDLSIDKLEDKVNNIITESRIVPRYPFYILSILQSLEAFMPRDLTITAYGHCYQALVTAQLLKKNIKAEQIDTCFNYLRELSFDIFRVSKEGKPYSEGDYANFRHSYATRFFIPDNVINRIDDLDYPILSNVDKHVHFKYSYIYYFFLGMYLAANENPVLLNEICENIHLKENSFIIIFTVHHAQNKSLLETILAHCVCSFDHITPAGLSVAETRFMNELIAELPKNIVSNTIPSPIMM
jgi:hypothetical protein